MATLKIYRAPSGQWSGQLLDDDGVEVAGLEYDVAVYPD